MIGLKPCPFCGGPNISYFRYNIGTNYPNANGDMFRISCDCGCRFEKCQDELFERVEEIYSNQGKYGVEIVDDDLWNVLAFEWNNRFESKLMKSVERHKEALDMLAEDD